MKKNIPLFLLFAIPLFCMAQNPLTREYYYDNSGNRILRKKIEMNLFSPPPPQDTANYTASAPEEENLQEPYFLETLAQTAIKIYPNPTTEKIALEVSGWETLQSGMFKLYTLTGQLLQERSVHALTTTISLSGLPKGSYILKVQINEQIEEWKIIKN